MTESKRSPRSVTTDAPPRAVEWAALLVLVAVGGALRLWRLDLHSMWNDELSSVVHMSGASLAAVYHSAATRDINPPGYYLLLHAVASVLGTSESALRLPSALAGTLAIPAVYLVGRRLWSGREGLVAAGLMASLHPAIWWSRNVRAYALLLLLACLSAFFYIGVWTALAQRGRLPVGDFVGWLLTGAALIWVHYFGLALVALELVAAVPAFIRASWAGRGWILAGTVLLAASFAPWVPHLWGQRGRPTWMRAPDLGALRSYYIGVFASVWEAELIALLLVAAVVVVLWRSRAKARPEGPTVAVLLWLLVPVLGAWFFSRSFQHIFSDRNLIITMPAAYLLTGRAVVVLVPRWRPLLVVTAALMMCGLVNLFAQRHYYTTPQGGQFRQAVHWVVRRARLSDRPLIVTSAYNLEYLNYYFRQFHSPLRADLERRKTAGSREADKLIRERRPRQVFLVAVHHNFSSGVLKFFEGKYRTVHDKGFYKAHVWLLEDPRPE